MSYDIRTTPDFDKALKVLSKRYISIKKRFVLGSNLLIHSKKTRFKE